MNRHQFDLALNQAKPSDWAHFEVLCSNFLSSEHSSMRTMASASGDGGRDSQLLNPDGINHICAQYSLAKDWKSKILKTQRRLREKFGTVKILIYLSNQEIGANGDHIRKNLSDVGIFLDIRDRNWFLERFNSDTQRHEAANEFFERVGLPYLEGLEVIDTKRSALTNQESKSALIYLGMQWEDTKTDKGLTKLSYEALVRAALRKSNAENLVSRGELYAAIHSYLPNQTIESIKIYVDSALNRLDNKVVKHIKKIDKFHLAFEEHKRLSENLAYQEFQENALYQEISRNIKIAASELSDENIQTLSKITLQVLDLALLKSGENFSASVLSGSIHKLDPNIVQNLILDNLQELSGNAIAGMPNFPQIIKLALDQTIRSDNESVRKHIKTLSDTYTLFAFLRETPDVQKATRKIFSHGKVWLDTTLILPLLADSLRSEGNDGRFSRVVRKMTACGIEVLISQGTVNEVLNHLRLSVACSNKGLQWRGRVPYLYSQYLQEGRDKSRFSDWIARFRGSERPDEDIRDFLNHEFKIELDDLVEDYLKSDENLRFSVDKLWRDAHTVRRNADANDADPETVDILIKNDVISYLGIVERRKSETSADLGYKHWWLTIDSNAWEIRNSLGSNLVNPPSSPLMSLDFLVQNMTFGPNKSNLSRTDEQLLPVLLDLYFRSCPTRSATRSGGGAATKRRSARIRHSPEGSRCL